MYSLWRGFIKVLVCSSLLVLAVYFLTSFHWYYYIWDASYFERAHNAYLMQFPQAKEVTTEGNHLMTITIKNTDYYSLPFAKLFINEEQITDFRDSQVTILIKNGDRIFLDTSYYEMDLNFEITSASGGVVLPVIGEKYSLQPKNNLLCEVITKELREE
jgi:hypothetical protein